MKHLPIFLCSLVLSIPAFAVAQTDPNPLAAEKDKKGLESVKSLSETQQINRGNPNDASVTNQTVWTANAGAVLNTGNTRAFTANVGTRALLVRGMNAWSGDLQYAYGTANVRDASGNFTGFKKNADNLNAQARYERFLTYLDALFFGVRYRRDPFAGLDTRLQLQTGYQRHFYRYTNHRFWGEIGYDFTYDNFDPDPLLDPMTSAVLDGSQAVHSARGFLGYENRLYEAVTFVTGFEFLYDLETSRNWRAQWVNELTSKLSDRFQLSLTFAARYDHEPVVGKEELDTLTMVNLVFNFI